MAGVRAVAPQLGLKKIRMTEVFLSGSSKKYRVWGLFPLEPFHIRNSISSKISII